MSDATRWRDEFRFLLKELERIHPNLYHRHPKGEWSEVVRRLEERLPEMTRHEVVAGLVRVVALAEDGHTALFDLPRDGAGFDTRFPVECWHFADGLYVRRAAERYVDLFGKRITHVNDFRVGDAVTALRPYISAENEMWMLNGLPTALRVPALLRAAGVIERSDAPLSLTVLDATGSAETWEIEGVSAASEPAWVAADDVSETTTLPLYRRAVAHYTFDYLEAERTVYVDHRTVRNAEAEAFAAFSGRLFTFVAAHPVEKMVIDIRQNGGGNLTLNQPLVHGLIANKQLNQTGKLFVIVGRGTFSAAMHLASYLERETHALFVGEPTGSSPNHFGDPEPIHLPNLGITVFCSTAFWQNSEPWDVRPWIVPDVPAPLRFADFVQRRDPAWEAIRTYKAGPDAEHHPPVSRWRRPGQQQPWTVSFSS